MAATPDRWVSEARLRELLARQSEAFDLDYKTTLDIQNDPRHRLRLVKLVAAMTGLSGDIVVGVDRHGTPTGQVTAALAQVYDEANLRPILLQHLPPLRVHSQTHVIDGENVVLVHVEPGDGGPLTLTRDGIYHDANNRPVYEFRAGERYIREGTSNALFTGSEHQVNLLLNQRAVAPPALDPADSMTFAAAPAELAAAARELLRAQDDVPLRDLLRGAEPRIRRSVGEQAWHDVTATLDRLIVLGGVYVSLGADTQARDVIETLRRVFELGLEESEVARQATAAWSPRLWLEVTARAEILGALALRLRRWEFVRELGLWKPAQLDARWVASWIRAAMTTRRHESWPRHDDERQTPKGVPELAAEIAETLPQLSEDIAGDRDRLRESIGHFDFAVCLMSIAEVNSVEQPVLMTDGTRLVGREGLTAFLRNIFRPGPARQAVFPRPDAELAVTLRQFERAMMERGYVAFGWYGETDAFIEEHYPREQE
jgi:Putative DNA-binding domain